MTPAYFDKFANVAIKRDEKGILEMRVHSDGGPLLFTASAFGQLMDACYEIGRDRDNKIVIFTGTGDTWCAEFDRRPPAVPAPPMDAFTSWDIHFWNGKKLIQNLLDIEVPVIAAVNGPALIHSELLLTCDIILGSEIVAFQDWPHLNNDVSPTDGVHVLWPYYLGPGRGRYFLLTQEKLDAQQALALGVCQEILAPDALMPRAYELANQLLRQPQLSLRYARAGLTQHLKKLVVDELALGMALESVTGAAAAAARAAKAAAAKS
jgi:enoyl-CoA hydratase/carnithine racemase